MNARVQHTTANATGAARSVVVLLQDLVDYAGLFPPASLGMSPAVANYDAYSRSEFAWMLGRFIVPAARLAEFGATLLRVPGPPAEGQTRWRISALLGPEVATDLARIRDFANRAASVGLPIAAQIESVEAKVASADDVLRLSEIIPGEWETYFEIPCPETGTSVARECISAAAACGRRAKIRTGGETADKFPSPKTVIEFISLCLAASLPFKATAGLHHPLRSQHRLTYHPGSPSGVMHGFLNVFLAAAFLRAGMERGVAAELLDERNAEAFHFAAAEVCWRNHSLSITGIDDTRHQFATSFGSCSFTEPVGDLRSLHLL